MEERNGIPKFDLADQIMSEQRKSTSVRRKGPAKRARSPKQRREADLVGHAIGAQPVSLGQDQVIADIVARDIDMLCRSCA